MGLRGSAPRPGRLYPQETAGTHCTGGWVGPRASLDGLKSSSPPGFDPGPSSLQSVAIPTELPGPPVLLYLLFYTWFIPSDMIKYVLWSDLTKTAKSPHLSVIMLCSAVMRERSLICFNSTFCECATFFF